MTRSSRLMAGLVAVAIGGCGRTSLLVDSVPRDGGTGDTWRNPDTGQDARGWSAPDAPAPTDAFSPGSIDAFALDAEEPVPDAAICPPTTGTVRVSTAIPRADIALLLETTGSMDRELRALARELHESVAVPLELRLDEVRVTGVLVSEYSPHTLASDHGVVAVGPISGTFADLEARLSRWPMDDGGDAPEAQVVGLSRVARGPLGRLGFTPPRTCAPGESPGACMAPRGARIAVLVSDSPFHEGPGGVYPYDPFVERWLDTPIPHFEETIAALVEERILVVGVSSAMTEEARAHMAAAVSGTGAIVDGVPVIVDVPPSGEGIGAAVRDAILAALDDVRRDMTVVVRSDRPVDWSAVSVIPPESGRIEDGRFVDVRPGAELEIAIRPIDGGVARVEIDVLDRGRLLLSRTVACVRPGP